MSLPRLTIFAVPLLGLCAIAAASLLFLADSGGPAARSAADNIVLLCDESVRDPIAGTAVEHGGGVLDLFQRRGGVRIEARYGEGEALFERARERAGDLYLPDDPAWIERAEREGLVHQTFVIAALVPVILVERSNPHDVRGVPDLARTGLRLAVADPDESELGRVTAELFSRHGLDPDSFDDIEAVGGTAREVAEAVHRGRADAGIVWRQTAVRRPGTTRAVEIPLERNVVSQLSIAVLAGSPHLAEAGDFARFAAGPAGRQVFLRYRFGAEAADDEASATVPLLGGG